MRGREAIECSAHRGWNTHGEPTGAQLRLSRASAAARNDPEMLWNHLVGALIPSGPSEQILAVVILLHIATGATEDDTEPSHYAKINDDIDIADEVLLPYLIQL